MWTIYYYHIFMYHYKYYGLIMKILRLLYIVFPLLLGIVNAQTSTPPAFGDGSSGDPYQIANLNNLYWLTQDSAEWAKEFVITADIDASETVDWDAGQGFTPIGTSATNPFTGKIHGRGHVISNIYMNRNLEYMAFFGYLSGAHVDSLGLKHITIIENSVQIGLLNEVAAFANRVVGGSVIEYSYATGIIETSTQNEVGAFVYYVENATITNAYADIHIQSDGVKLAGFAYNVQTGCSISDSYSGSSTSGEASGFIYQGSAGATISNSFFDSDAIGSTITYAGTPKTEVEMQTQSTFTNAGWDFVNDWRYTSGNYPKLHWESTGAIDPYAEITGFDEIFDDSLKVTGIVNPGFSATTYYFEYGTISGSYTNQTSSVLLAARGDDIIVTASILNLQPNTPYYFRLVAESLIDTVYSEQQAVVTRAEMDEPTGNPRQVSTLAHLSWISYTPSAWGDDYELTADIDASETIGWEDGKGFSPIGNGITKFNGNFSGKGHTIDGLTINRPNENYAGLFGLISHASGNLVIDSLGLTNINFTNSVYTGSIAGRVESFASAPEGIFIDQCYATGTIHSLGGTGGLVGGIFNTVYISDSYVNVALYSSTTLWSGGLIGVLFSANDASVVNCLSVGYMELDDGGGLIGAIQAPLTIVVESFWDTESSTSGFSTGGVGKTTAELTDILTFTDASWDISASGDTTIWRIESGAYPVLSWQPKVTGTPIVNINDFFNEADTSATLSGYVNPAGSETTYYFNYGTSSGSLNQSTTPKVLTAGFSNIYVIELLNGLNPQTTYYCELIATNASGTTTSPEISFTTTPQQIMPPGDGYVVPFEISLPGHLVWIIENEQYWNAKFLQTADIDLSASVGWYNGLGFQPIGSFVNPFRGEYDGNEKTISFLSINESTGDNGYLGFFGVVDGATISDLAITNASVQANYTSGFSPSAGILVAWIQSSIDTVRISGCMTSGSLNIASVPENYVGGLFGLNNGVCKISDSYSQTSLSGSHYVGGFAGNGTGAIISNSYSASTFSGSAPDFHGGFIAFSTSASITSSYWDTQLSGLTASADGIGKTTAEMKQLATFSGWSISASEDAGKTWYVDEGNNYPVFQWQAVFSPEAPTVFTLAADQIAADSARLNGLVTANQAASEWYFEYGTTSGVYGSQTPVDSVFELVNETSVSATITGLLPNTTYYYRLSANNSAGSTNGSEFSFTTTTAPSKPAGSGTALSPYLLTNIDELVWLMSSDTTWDDVFALANDIDASGSADLEDGAGFSPVGNSAIPFSGQFNGRGNLITGLTINRDSENDIGFFGVVSNGVIDSLGLTAVDILGNSQVGSLAGMVTGNSTVEMCYSSGYVEGANDIGGLVGLLQGSSFLRDCYASNRVKGGIVAAGLVGEHKATVTRCYSTGKVTGSGFAGGLIGKNSGGITTVSYWNIETSGRVTSAGGTGKTTSELRSNATFVGWDLNVDWRIDEGKASPYLGWETMVSDNTVIISSTGPVNQSINDASAIHSLNLLNVTSAGDINIKFYEDVPANPTNILGNISQYRWLLSPGTLVINEGTGYTVRFNLGELFGNGGINEYTGADPNVSDIDFYIRSTHGSGGFTAVSGDFLYYNNGTIGNRDDDYMVSPLITAGFGEIAFGTTSDQPLPIELVSFTASSDFQGITLQWQTGSELQNLGFKVLRSDTEDGNYQVIASYEDDDDLLGLGTSATGKVYTFTDEQANLEPGKTYYYQLADEDFNGNINYSSAISVATLVIPKEFRLHQNYPNPFNPTTKIAIELDAFAKDAKIEIFDITGRLVRTLYKGPINQYRITFEWDGRNSTGNLLATGMYFYRYQSARNVAIRKMILMK
jgi:hypothetical protein